MLIYANQQPVICGNLNVRNIDGETVILDRSTNQIHTLNTTASFIWNMLEQQSDLDSIAKQLTESFEITLDAANSDLHVILEALSELNLLK